MTILSVGEYRIAAEGIIAGDEFFHVFSYPLLQGDADQVLNDKNVIVLSESMALKLFNTTEDIVGKAVEWDYTGFDGLFQISGIVADPPANSTQQFDFILNLAQLKDNDRWADRWTGSTGRTFVILKKGTDPDAFRAKIARIMEVKDPINTSNTSV